MAITLFMPTRSSIGFIIDIPPDKSSTMPMKAKPLQHLSLSLLSSAESISFKIPDTSSQTPKYITAAVSYLTENFTRKITADELAATVGVGRTTLMTGFKKYMGVTMNEYVTGCRLKQAIKQMRSGSTIDEAAEECGYADGSCLIRVFKKRFGVTPMEYLGRKLR